MTTLAPAVFLDRDGTVIEEAGYLDSLDRMHLFPWSVDALRLVARAGYRRVVVTNQGGIALGLFDRAFVEETHRALAALLDDAGAGIEGFYYCPHHPDRPLPFDTERQADDSSGLDAAARTPPGCACRKPAPGLLQQAARDLGIDLSRSYAIGDRWGDVALARSAGLRGGILVRTGYGRSAEQRPAPDLVPAYVADHLLDAVGWILRQDR
jgi:D-glycero-D-manno-heptose 1,7-bisphosphate phosphatase